MTSVILNTLFCHPKLKKRIKNKPKISAGEMSVFLSTNSATTWVKVLENVKPSVVAFSTSTSRAYAACDYSLIYKSEDDGYTWTRQGPEFDENLFMSLCSSNLCVKANLGLAVDPGNPDIIYAAGEDLQDEIVNHKDYSYGIFKNVKSGDFYSWEKIYTLASGEISSLISPSAGNFCFSIKDSGGGKLICYVNGFKHEYDNGGAMPEIYALSFNPDNTDEIYACGDSTLLKSSDKGVTWNTVTAPNIPSDSNIYLKLAVRGNNSLIVCSGHYCAESSNGGSSWSSPIEIDSTFANFAVSEYMPGNIVYSKGEDKIYLNGDSAIYKGNGSGFSSFLPANAGLYNVAFYSLYHDLINDVLYAGTYSDIYVSTDSGTTWNNIKIGGKRYGITHNYNAIIARSDAVYAAINGNIYKTTDKGANWLKVNSSNIGLGGFGIGNLISMVENPNASGTFYLGTGMSDAGMSSPGIYKSIDSGATWSRMDFLNLSTPTVTFIEVSTVSASTMYAIAFEDFQNDENSYLYKTSDGGSSWNKVATIDSALNAGYGNGWINSMQQDPDYGDTLYVANDWYLVISKDGGATWTRLYTNAGGGIKKFMIVHPAAGARTMYLGVDDKVYLSIDEGATWSLAGSGFNGTRAFAQGSVYVGTSEGLYKAQIAAMPLNNLSKTTLNSADSKLSVEIPAGSFASGVSALLLPIDKSAQSYSGFKAGKLGLDIVVSDGSQPMQPITIRFSYTPADISGLDEAKLAVVRLNNDGTYEVIDSTVDVVNKTVTAVTTHFSSFVLGQYTPASSAVAMPVAYPMPFSPAVNTTGMVIDKILAGSQVRIFTITGQLVRKLDANGSGQAVWNGKNEDGRMVASGIYIAIVKDAANKTKKLKIAVEK